jgi:hypothetical protein
MPDYRIFFYNDREHFVGADTLAADNDDSVLSAARCLLGGRSGLEIWLLARQVGRLEADPPAIAHSAACEPAAVSEIEDSVATLGVPRPRESQTDSQHRMLLAAD